MNTIYDVDYFIKKVSAIPEELWFVGDFFSPHDNRKACFLGHCDYNEAKEASALRAINDPEHTFAWVNDGNNPKYQQPTPKQRILAALYDIKKAQQPDIDTGTLKEVKERIVYVTVDAPVRELQKEELIKN